MREYDNRKDAWEGNAQETLNNFLRMTENELIALVKNGDRDDYFVLRSALKEKGTKEKSGPVLISVLYKLNDNQFFLHRYHICETLFYILGINDKQIFRAIVGNNEQVNVNKKNVALKKIQEKYHR